MKNSRRLDERRDTGEPAAARSSTEGTKPKHVTLDTKSKDPKHTGDLKKGDKSMSDASNKGKTGSIHEGLRTGSSNPSFVASTTGSKETGPTLAKPKAGSPKPSCPALLDNKKKSKFEQSNTGNAESKREKDRSDKLEPM